MLKTRRNLAETILLDGRETLCYNRRGGMNVELRELILTESLGVMRIHDRQNRRLEMRDRYASALIIPLRGQLRFTQNGCAVLCDPSHPLFVPEGACYLNECLQEADSLLFGFHALNAPPDIQPLQPIDVQRAQEACRRMELLAAQGAPERLALLSEAYALLSLLLAEGESPRRADRLLEPALRMMAEEYARPDLCCEQLAQAAHLSEVYLRRLFLRRYRTTPFQYLTALRMSRAQTLLLEGRPVKEVALSVGYSDVYSFSRAYKRRFGQAPGQTRCVNKEDTK